MPGGEEVEGLVPVTFSSVYSPTATNIACWIINITLLILNELQTIII